MLAFAGVVRSVTARAMLWYGAVNAVPAPEVLYRSALPEVLLCIWYFSAKESATWDPLDGTYPGRVTLHIAVPPFGTSTG
jgi:hypothetical protein